MNPHLRPKNLPRTNDLTLLKHEVALLRSLMIGFIAKTKDREGAYRPEFVKRVFAASLEQPTYEFKDPESFLAQLR